MAELSKSDLEDLRALATRASDAALERLAADLPAPAVAAVFLHEQAERNVRAAVFAPLAPFISPGAGGATARLPADALACLWRMARELYPTLCDGLMLRSKTGEQQQWRDAADDLCLRLARALARAEDDPSRSALSRLAALDGAGLAAQQLLALAPLVRTAITRLPTWTHHLTAKSSGELRNAFAAAAKLGEASGPLFLEALSGALDEPCQVLRLVSLILDQPSDALLADSALNPLCERLIADVERGVDRVRAFVAGSGEGQAVGAAVMGAAAALLEFEQWVDVGRAGPWGARLAALRRALAIEVEARLKVTPKLMAEALPTRAARWTQRSAPRTPKLSRDPEADAMRRAEDQAAFLAAIRRSPSTSGFAALLAKVCAELDDQLDSYVEGLLDLLHRASAEDRPRLQAFLDVAARLTERFGGEPAGRIVRRRAAAA